jgi:hypothetical protein
MLTMQYALDLAHEGFTFVSLSPGVSIPLYSSAASSVVSLLDNLRVRCFFVFSRLNFPKS